MGLYYIDADTGSFFDGQKLITEASGKFQQTVGKKPDSIYMSRETHDMLFGPNIHRTKLMYFGLRVYIETKTPFGMLSLGHGVQHENQDLTSKLFKKELSNGYDHWSRDRKHDRMSGKEK